MKLSKKIPLFIWQAILKPPLEALFGALGFIWIAGAVTLLWLIVPFNSELPIAFRIFIAVVYWLPVSIISILHLWDEWESLK